MAASLPHHDKLMRLEEDILRHCDNDHPYTHLLLLRVREDQLWGRVPALFQSSLAHWLGYLAPLFLLNMGLLLAQAHEAGRLQAVLLWSNLFLTSFYAAIGAADWRYLTQTRQRLRLPLSFAEYPRLR